uniref:Exosome complex component Csl4 n=1 Tax=Geoglobus ahangari TaxID=113653 RepID=A0A7C3UH61_9EURY
MFVFPGDFLGYVEEYIAGEGVYEEDGKLYASKAGKLQIRDRTISILPIKTIPEIKKGDIIIGRIIDTKNNFAMVEIARKRGSDRVLGHYDRALLHISNVSDKYTKSIEECVRFWDIISAKVIDDNLRISIKEEDLGVLKAICSVCGENLIKKEGDKLKCPKCGNVEKRKISKNYGKGVW